MKRRKAWRLNQAPAQKQPFNDGHLMTRAELAEYLSVSVATIARWKCEGTQAVPEVRIGVRTIRYRKSDIDAWLAAGVDFHPSV